MRVCNGDRGAVRSLVDDPEGRRGAGGRMARGETEEVESSVKRAGDGFIAGCESS